MNLGPVIETPRLILRPHQLEDYDACCALHRDPEAVRMIYQQPLTHEESWHRLLRYVGHWALLGYGLLIVEERVSRKVVGEVGMADFHRGLGEDFDSWPEFAWMISSHVHGRGYATEAARAMLDWADREFGPERTVCMIDPDNGASLRVADKLGFNLFGRDHYKGKAILKLHRFVVPS